MPTSPLQEILKRLVQAIAALGLAAANALQPGAAPAELASVQQILAGLLPQEVVTLYQWRNGFAAEQELFPDFYFFSLQQGVAVYEQMVALTAEVAVVIGGKSVNLWNPSWFPIGQDTAGRLYVINTEAVPSSAAPLYLIDPESLGTGSGSARALSSISPSLTAFFQFALLGYTAGIFTTDEEGRLQSDPERAALLKQAQLNESAKPSAAAPQPSDLIQALRSADGEAAGQAAETLMRQPALAVDAEWVAELATLLRDQRAPVNSRALAATILGEQQVKSAAAVLLTALNDPSTKVQASAAEALGKLKEKGAIAALLLALQQGEFAVQSRVIWALGAIKGKEAAAGLLPVLQHPNAILRSASAQALGQLRAKNAFEPLLPLLVDPSSEVRYHAAWALGQIKNSQAKEHLLPLLQDPDPPVRRAAENAIRRLP